MDCPGTEAYHATVTRSPTGPGRSFPRSQRISRCPRGHYTNLSIIVSVVIATIDMTRAHSVWKPQKREEREYIKVYVNYRGSYPTCNRRVQRDERERLSAGYKRRCTGEKLSSRDYEISICFCWRHHYATTKASSRTDIGNRVCVHGDTKSSSLQSPDSFVHYICKKII
jgi:hypothetical protein